MAGLRIVTSFTKFPNELMEALARLRIPGEARQVLDVIIRRTYGWQRHEAEISLPDFSSATTLSKVHVCRALAKLREMNLITQNGNNSILYSFQDNHAQWLPLPKKVTLPKKVADVTQKGNEMLPKKMALLKERKERKKSPPISPQGGEGVRDPLLEERFNRFTEAYPKKRSLGRAWRVWCSIQPSEQLLAEMLSAIERAKTSVEWSREGGRFIPHPASWLEAHGWRDEFTPASSPDRQTSQSPVPKILYTQNKGQWFKVIDGSPQPVSRDEVPPEILARAESNNCRRPTEEVLPEGMVKDLVTMICRRGING